MNTSEHRGTAVDDGGSENQSIVSIGDNGEALITSLAISEGVEYHHATVIRLVRQNLDDFNDFGRVRFEIQPFETLGGRQSRELAFLNEPQCTLLMTYMRNNQIIRRFKKRLVREFYELAKQRQQSSQKGSGGLSIVQLLEMGLESAKENIRKTEQIERDRPKVEFAKLVEDTAENKKIDEVAKILDIPPKKFRAFMREIRWLTTDSLPMQQKKNALYLDVKMGTYINKQTGERVPFATTVITGKGMTRLHQLWNDRLLDGDSRTDDDNQSHVG